jgi:hypothetical protein
VRVQYGPISPGATKEAFQQKVPVIAVTDDGVDLDHVDLAAVIWVNPGETPLDSIDNDANGFIDDVNSWFVILTPMTDEANRCFFGNPI